MAKDYKMEIEIVADNKASKELAKIQGDAKNTGKQFQKLGLLVAGAFVVTKVVQYGKEMTKMATEMELLDKKANIVFGDEGMEMVNEWAERSASAMGMTNRAYANAAAGIGDLLVPMGFAKDEAAAMSVELVDLSGSLSEWTGGQKSATEISDILAKAMLGEREQLKSLGIAISADEVAQKAHQLVVEEGLLLNELEANAQATLLLAYEKSTDAQAAYAENGDTLMRKQVEMQAQMKNLKEELVVALTPAIADATTKVTEMATQILQDEDTMEQLEATFKAIGDTVIFVTEGIFGFINAIDIALDYIADFIGQMAVAYQKSNQMLGINGLFAGGKEAENFLLPEYQDRANSLGINGSDVNSAQVFQPQSFGPQTSNSQNVNINFGGVKVSNDNDIAKIAAKVQTVIVESSNNFQLGAI